MRQVGLFFVFLCSAASYAESDRVVRFWEGQKAEKTSWGKHLKYIQDKLAPETVNTGLGYMIHYILYIPPKGPLPWGAMESKLAFSEAAIPTYVDQEAYDEKNRLYPWYGPLHFEENGFLPGVSYSSTPIPFDPKRNLKISKSDPRSARVAYDLREFSEPEPNWQDGTTIVWLLLRKNFSLKTKFLSRTADIFEELTSDERIDGHYARVDSGHVLHFINVPDGRNASKVFDRIEGIAERLEQDEDSPLISHDLTIAVKKEVFESGWRGAISHGKALNVRFEQP